MEKNLANMLADFEMKVEKKDLSFCHDLTLLLKREDRKSG